MQIQREAKEGNNEKKRIQEEEKRESMSSYSVFFSSLSVYDLETMTRHFVQSLPEPFPASTLMRYRKQRKRETADPLRRKENKTDTDYGAHLFPLIFFFLPFSWMVQCPTNKSRAVGVGDTQEVRKTKRRKRDRVLMYSPFCRCIHLISTVPLESLLFVRRRKQSGEGVCLTLSLFSLQDNEQA